MKKNFKKIVLTESLYNLLLILLENTYDLDEIFFFIGNSLKLNDKYKNNSYEIKKNKHHRKMIRIILSYIFFIKLEIICRKNKLKNLQVYGLDHILGSDYFKSFYDIILFEDGTKNYCPEEIKKAMKLLNEKSIKKKISSKLVLETPSFGIYKNVKKIFLTGILDVPEELKNKVEIINLEMLWKNKTLKQKDEILEFFNVKDFFYKNKFQEKTIFLTQPLSEDGILSLEEEIILYKSVMEKYDEKNLIIKTHPREKKDYKKYFPNIEILDKKFPFELFKLNNVKFKKVATIFSTGAYNLGEETEVDFYGTQIHPKLEKVFGQINNF